VPTLPHRPTQKVTARFRKLVTLPKDEAKFAFIAFAPTLCNDRSSVYISGSQFIDNKINIGLDHEGTCVIGEGTKVSSYDFAQLPYTSNQMVGGDEIDKYDYAGRIVSAGIRLRYIGDLESTKGVVSTFVSPIHQNLNDTTIDDMQFRPGFKRRALNRDWVTLSIYANNDKEREFDQPGVYFAQQAAFESLDVNFPYSSGAVVATGDHYHGGSTETHNGGVPMVICLEHFPYGQLIEVEAVIHAEYLGEKITVNTSTEPPQNHPSAGDTEVVWDIMGRNSTDF